MVILKVHIKLCGHQVVWTSSCVDPGRNTNYDHVGAPRTLKDPIRS